MLKNDEQVPMGVEVGRQVADYWQEKERADDEIVRSSMDILADQLVATPIEQTEQREFAYGVFLSGVLMVDLHQQSKQPSPNSINNQRLNELHNAAIAAAQERRAQRSSEVALTPQPVAGYDTTTWLHYAALLYSRLSDGSKPHPPYTRYDDATIMKGLAEKTITVVPFSIRQIQQTA